MSDGKPDSTFPDIALVAIALAGPRKSLAGGNSRDETKEGFPCRPIRRILALRGESKSPTCQDWKRREQSPLGWR
jgi:hypothetical protein